MYNYGRSAVAIISLWTFVKISQKYLDIDETIMRTKFRFFAFAPLPDSIKVAFFLRERDYAINKFYL